MIGLALKSRVLPANRTIVQTLTCAKIVQLWQNVDFVLTRNDANWEIMSVQEPEIAGTGDTLSTTMLAEELHPYLDGH
jgi:hypothetical protein